MENRWVVKTIIAPKAQTDPKKFVWYVAPNHFTDIKSNAHEFFTREEAQDVANKLDFNAEVELACAKIIFPQTTVNPLGEKCYC